MFLTHVTCPKLAQCDAIATDIGKESSGRMFNVPYLPFAGGSGAALLADLPTYLLTYLLIYRLLEAVEQLRLREDAMTPRVKPQPA